MAETTRRGRVTVARKAGETRISIKKRSMRGPIAQAVFLLFWAFGFVFLTGVLALGFYIGIVGKEDGTGLGMFSVFLLMFCAFLWVLAIISFLNQFKSREILIVSNGKLGRSVKSVLNNRFEELEIDDRFSAEYVERHVTKSAHAEARVVTPAHIILNLKSGRCKVAQDIEADEAEPILSELRTLEGG